MKASSGKTIDMTQGSPFRHILSFMLPTMVGYLFQQFYSMADTVIIGRYLGEDALAAVGATGSINFMIIGFCMGLCSGFAIPIAQAFGAGDHRNLRRYLANSIYTAAVFSLVIAVIVYYQCGNILLLMKTPENILPGAWTYLSILFLGIPVTVMYNLSSGIMRSLGDSRTPVYFLLLSSALNIVLDLLMVRPMGIAGPAVATVISQAVSGILCILYMRARFDILRMKREDLRPLAHHIGNLLYMGIPMGLQYSITAIGSVVLQSAVNVLGSTYVASSATALKVSLLFCCPFDALGSTAATYSGQNIGAGRLDRISQGVRWSIIIGCVYALLADVIMFTCGPQLVKLFLSEPSELLLKNATLYLRVNSAAYCLLVLVNVLRFFIQGMGFSVLAICAGIFEMIARAFAGFYLVPRFGYVAATMASPIAWVLADTFLILAYLHVMKKLRLRIKSPQPQQDSQAPIEAP
ncbi:MAG: MATE family efflux transporter [Lachnospiraceae bacterium]|nr:MATE family efflux transporter [Lachnospiraceae bacterium]